MGIPILQCIEWYSRSQAEQNHAEIYVMGIVFINTCRTTWWLMFCFYENWELYIHVILLQVINYVQLHVFVLLHTPTSEIIILIFHNKHYLGEQSRFMRIHETMPVGEIPPMYIEQMSSTVNIMAAAAKWYWAIISKHSSFRTRRIKI